MWNKYLGWIDFKAILLVVLVMWHFNNMAHFNNLRHGVLDNNNKITKICEHLKQCKVVDDEY